jgi:hypothetical protein
MRWGWLHDFALDCMRFGLQSLPFDTMTIVDSDQLCVGQGYSEYLARWAAGRTGLGLLGSAPPPGKRTPISPPAAQAYKERPLWAEFSKRFPGGEAKFVHWTFWPSTVFTAEASRALLELWPDTQLQSILSRTKIWASEEVILPTLVALLGFGVELNPCRHDFVRYRTRYTTAQMDTAILHRDTFWVHPVPRRYDDVLRSHLRRKFNGYDGAEGGAPVSHLDERRERGPLPTLPILAEIRPLEGWLSDEEADLLIATAADALRGDPDETIVEVGSYCGKATIALARVAQARGGQARVLSIDAHDGVVGSRDGALSRNPPTREKLDANLTRAGVRGLVDVRQGRSQDVTYEGRIRFLVVDGLHDYGSVGADFRRFENAVDPDGYVAFHDYAGYFPGVRLFVNELLQAGTWALVRTAGSLVVLRRRDRTPVAHAVEAPGRAASLEEPAPQPAAAPTVAAVAGAVPRAPRVTCIMPTANRRAFVPRAIRLFLAQTYENRELVIVDDGSDAVRDLVPLDDRVRYIRLERRRTVGEKRNIACREATGSIIVHWDDDDWSAPTRLEYQVGDLERDGAAVAGLSAVYYLDPSGPRAFQYRYPRAARRWVAGNTLCYRRAHWEKHHFADVDVGEDARFVWKDRSARLLCHADPNFFVATIHSSNVAKKHVEHRFWHPVPLATIREIMGESFEPTGAIATAPSEAS